METSADFLQVLLISLLAFASTPLDTDTSVGGYLLLSMNWFYRKTLEFLRNDVHSYLLSGLSKE